MLGEKIKFFTALKNIPQNISRSECVLKGLSVLFSFPELNGWSVCGIGRRRIMISEWMNKKKRNDA